MKSVFSGRVTLIWLLLIGATTASWWLGVLARQDQLPPWLAPGIVVIAFVKVRYVMLDFMEIRNAPRALRVFAEAWVVVLGGVILVLDLDPQLIGGS